MCIWNPALVDVKLWWVSFLSTVIRKSPNIIKWSLIAIENFKDFYWITYFFEMTTDFQKGYFVNNKTADSSAEYHLILK